MTFLKYRPNSISYKYRSTLSGQNLYTEKKTKEEKINIIQKPLYNTCSAQNLKTIYFQNFEFCVLWGKQKLRFSDFEIDNVFRLAHTVLSKVLRCRGNYTNDITPWPILQRKWNDKVVHLGPITMIDDERLTICYCYR